MASERLVEALERAQWAIRAVPHHATARLARWHDQHRHPALELIEQALAAHRAAQAERDDTCPECQGAGEYDLPDPLDGGEEPYLCDECRGTGKRPAPALATDACPGCATWQQALDQHRRQEHGEQARDYQPDYEGALTIVDEQANRLADLLLKTRQQRDEAERLLERLYSISYSGSDMRLLAVGLGGVNVKPEIHQRCDAIDALRLEVRDYLAARRPARGEADRA